MVLQERIELSTSPLPRVCSTTELLQRRCRYRAAARGDVRLSSQKRGGMQVHFPAHWRGVPGLIWTMAGTGGNEGR